MDRKGCGRATMGSYTGQDHERSGGRLLFLWLYARKAYEDGGEKKKLIGGPQTASSAVWRPWLTWGIRNRGWEAPLEEILDRG